MNIRNAHRSDLPFIVKCIIESEKSNTDVFPYKSLFGLNEDEFFELMESVFDEEIENQPWYLEYWYICEMEKVAVAGCCAWIEPSIGLSSDMLKTQILSALLGKVFHNNLEKLKIVSKANIRRKPNTLQFEHLYTDASHRGKGAMSLLLNTISESMPFTEEHEIQLLKSNKNAHDFYKRIGFVVSETQCNPDILRLNLLGDSCKLKMVRKSH